MGYYFCGILTGMPFPTFPNKDPPKLPEDNDDTLPFS